MATSGNGVREDHAPWPVEVEAPEAMYWTEDDFEALIETGAADRLGRIELRGGVVWRMNPINVPHAIMRERVARALQAALKRAGLTLEVLQEATIRFPDYMPTADIVLFEYRRQRKSIPSADARLAVEICDTTHRDDFGDKRMRYAAGRLAEYWIVDIPGRHIHRFDKPGRNGFREAPIVVAGARCESLTLPGLSIATKDLPWD